MESLRFYISTWNVATRSPKHDLNSFLDYPSTFNENRVHADFYILGFQEVKAGAQNIIIDSIFEDPWTKKLSKILSKAGYVAAKFVKLQGIFLIVFTLTKHLPHIRDLEANYIKTGLGGLWGNKGAVAIRFNLYGCSFCFINSHLAAHDKYYKARLEEYHYIVNSLTFKAQEYLILDHDYVFWMGDLNFRILEETEGANTHDEILNALESVEKSNYSILLKNDQLNFARANGLAFSEFREAEIRFKPTFKFEIDTDVYNIKRRPAWTDRVLSRVLPDHYEGTKLGAHTVVYHSLPQYKQSDHKPVVAEFDVKVRTKTEYVILRQGPISRSGRDGVSDNEPTQVVSHYMERTVEFAPINDSWYWEDDTFTIRCTLSPDISIYKHDYIAIFKVEFTSLDDPITTVEIRDITNVDELEEFQIDDESSSDSESSEKDLEALPGLINKALTTTLVTTTDDSTEVSSSKNKHAKKEPSRPSVPDPKSELAKDHDSADTGEIKNSQSATTGSKDKSENKSEIQEAIVAAKTDENAPEAKESRTIDLTFKAKVAKHIKKKGYYIFMYISKPRSGVKSCLGISEPFEVTSQEKEDESGSEDEVSDVDSNASTGPGSRCSTPPPDEEFDNLSISHDKCFDFVALKKHFENLGNDDN